MTNQPKFEQNSVKIDQNLKIEKKLDIQGLCSRKEGNCQEKSNLCLYAKYDFQAEISPDLALTHFLFFPAGFFFSIAKAPYENHLKFGQNSVKITKFSHHQKSDKIQPI